MRIALAQINPTVGDLAANAAKHADFIRRAKEAGARLVVFPELSITGYPPKDLLLKPSFIDANLAAVRDLAKLADGIDVIVGYADRNAAPVGRPLHNAVAVLSNGEVASRHFKTLLPTYDVFDESRYFEPGPDTERNNVISACDTKLGVSICEDLWNDERLMERRLYHQNPIQELHLAGAAIIVNASASPFFAGKHAFRRELFASQVRGVGTPLVYVNQVGGNDELVFDGNSLAINADGEIVAQAKEFEEDLLIVEIGDPCGVGVPPTSPAGVPPAMAKSANLPSREGPGRDAPATRGRDAHATVNRRETPSDGIASVHKALVLGLRDYVVKCGFQTVVLGLSGGIDSAVVAALAVEAFGPGKVTGVAMPSRYSSGGSVTDAKKLAGNLGITFHVIPIQPMHAAFEAALADVFEGTTPGVTEENLQARTRGATLMALSNKFNHLLLTTGNKSEIAVGYCTIYGDMCGGLAVISDLPKTGVYALAEHLNAAAGRDLIPRSTIEKPPSAELAPDQKDSDSLPPYDELDDILERYVERDEPAEQIIRAGHDPAVVRRVITLTDRSEYKRRQAAPGLKVTSRAFGFGRRMPIAQRYTDLPQQHGEPSPTFNEGAEKQTAQPKNAAR